MAHVHNALHHFTALQAAYRAALGEDDASFNGIERAGETLTPIFDLWSRPDWAVLRDEVLWSALHNQAAVVGELSFVGIRNPAASGLLVVVTMIRARGSAGGILRVIHGVISATGVDGSEQLVPRDTRLNLAGVSRAVKIHGADAAMIGNDAFEEIFMDRGSAGTATEDVPQSVILSPGFEVRYYHQTANTALVLTAQGYLRPAQPGEL